MAPCPSQYGKSDMFPSATHTSSGGGSLAYLEKSCQLVYGNTVLMMHYANEPNLVWRQYDVLYPSSALGHVCHIFLVSSNNKMGDANASWVVASMQYISRPYAGVQIKGEFVDADEFALESGATVSIAVNGFDPLKALLFNALWASFVSAFPTLCFKPLLDFFISHILFSLFVGDRRWHRQSLHANGNSMATYRR